MQKIFFKKKTSKKSWNILSESLVSALSDLQGFFSQPCTKKMQFLQLEKFQKWHGGTLCCALRNKNAKNMEKSFSKSTPVSS